MSDSRRRRRVRYGIAAVALVLGGLTLAATARDDGDASEQIDCSETPAIGGDAYRADPLPEPLPASTGRRRYVSTTGSDDNSGSELRPWRSIQYALEQAQPGELILVGGGRYVGPEATGPDRNDGIGPSVYASPRGEASAPITIQPCADEEVVVESAIWLPSPQWFRMSGLLIDGPIAAPGKPAVILGSPDDRAPSHVEISGNEVMDNPGPGILHYSGTDTALIGNRIHHIGNTAHNNGISLERGRRVVVANNAIFGVSGGHGVLIEGDFDDSWVINNLVTKSVASGVVVAGLEGRGSPDRVVIANNIFFSHDRTDDPPRGYAVRVSDPGTDNSVRHNIGWGNGRGPGQFQLGAVEGIDNRNEDPQVEEQGVWPGDIRLGPNGPARDAGEDFGLLVDIAGDPRDDGAPDIGAYEYR